MSPPIHASINAVTTTRVAEGFASPVWVGTAPGDSDHLFVLELATGRVEMMNLETGVINADAFLTVPDVEAVTNEQGLFGMAFHPDYQANGKFYLYYTAPEQLKLVEYQVSDNPALADPESERPVLTLPNPSPLRHHGGWIGFNPKLNPEDSQYLHVSIGDGFNDVYAAQTIENNLLGSILRIDVDGDDFPEDDSKNYAIPPGNPFVDQAGDDEIIAFGLRNPWRASFDRETGDLWIGDVGHNTREEIDMIPAGSAGGENFGWPFREGFIATPDEYRNEFPGGDPPEGNVDPIHDYSHDSGRCVTGGYMYRGPIEALQGQYLFADCGLGTMFTLDYDAQAGELIEVVDRTTQFDSVLGNIDRIRSFGEDEEGNVYFVDAANGEVFTFIILGDFDGNHRYDAFDVDEIEQALANREAFLADHPDIDIDLIGDVDRNGVFDAFDVAGIEQLLAGANVFGAAPLQVPEPSTFLALTALGFMSLGQGRRRSR